MNSKIRPATIEDIKLFPGAEKKTIRAFAIEYEGEVKALAGTYRHGNMNVLFSHILDHTAPKITVFRTAKKILEAMPDIPIFALADECIEGSGKFLESLGFTQVKGNTYIWLNSQQQR